MSLLQSKPPLVGHASRARRILDGTCERSATHADSTRLATGPAPSGIRSEPVILLVDDDPGAIQALRAILAPLGTVHFAMHGEAALALIRSLLPDLVVLDACLPQMSGFEVCAALKGDPLLRHIAVVFVTGSDNPGFESQALGLGAADFIGKPFNRAVVRGRVRNILELKRNNDAALAAAQAHWRMLSDARVADVVQGVHDGVVTVNALGRVVLANPAAGRMLGRIDTDIVGRRLADLIGVDLQAPGAATPSSALEITLPDPASARVEISSSSIGESDEALLTVVMRDLSERDRLRAEADLRLGEEEHNRTKAMMAAFLAHEIGNPVHGIINLVTLMASDPHSPLPPEQSRRLELLARCSRQVRDLIQDFVAIQQVEANALQLQPGSVELRSCVEDAVAAVAGQAELAGIRIATEFAPQPVHALADGTRLRQVLVNMISNAVKYNRRSGQVFVRVSLADERVLVRVEDNGAGMSAAQLEHLFEPYNRLGRQSGSVPGTGLGLALSRKLILAMQGRLSVHSEAGCGTAVLIDLPCAQVPAKAKP